MAASHIPIPFRVQFVLYIDIHKLRLTNYVQCTPVAISFEIAAYMQIIEFSVLLGNSVLSTYHRIELFLYGYKINKHFISAMMWTVNGNQLNPLFHGSCLWM